MNFSINKNIYNRIIKSRTKFINQGIGVQFCISNSPHVGFILPSSLGSACQRNLFKRRCREALLNISKNISVLIKPKSLNVTYKDIIDTFNNIKLN